MATEVIDDAAGGAELTGNGIAADVVVVGIMVGILAPACA